MLRIRDVNAGSRIRIFIHPGFRARKKPISDPGSRGQKLKGTGSDLQHCSQYELQEIFIHMIKYQALVYYLQGFFVNLNKFFCLRMRRVSCPTPCLGWKARMLWHTRFFSLILYIPCSQYMYLLGVHRVSVTYIVSFLHAYRYSLVL